MPRVGEKSRYPRLPRDKKAERPAAFSPGGRLLQIEYARECPMGGPLALAMRTRGGVVLAKARSAEPELGHRIPGIWNVTSRIAYVANGNLGDLYYRHLLRPEQSGLAVTDLRSRQMPSAKLPPTQPDVALADPPGHPSSGEAVEVAEGSGGHAVAEIVAPPSQHSSTMACSRTVSPEAEDRSSTRSQSWCTSQSPEGTLVRRIYGRRRFVSTFLRHRRGG